MVSKGNYTKIILFQLGELFLFQADTVVSEKQSSATYPHVVGTHITFKKVKSEKPLFSMANSGDELDAHLGLTTSQWGPKTVEIHGNLLKSRHKPRKRYPSWCTYLG